VFGEGDLALLTQISEEADDALLQARLADLAWLLTKPRSVTYALRAVDAYRRVPLEVKSWGWGGRECWARAVALALMLRAAAMDRLEKMETALIARLMRANEGDGYLPMWIADLLHANHLGLSSAAQIVSKLEAIAGALQVNGELPRSRDMFQTSAKWAKRAKDDDGFARLTVHESETWVQEAVLRASSTRPGNSIAATFLENAIKTYRTIPRALRNAYSVDDRIAELHRRMRAAAESSLSEMAVLSSGPIDLTEAAETAQKAVRGKPAAQALLAFVNLPSGILRNKLRMQAQESLTQHPLRALFASTHMSRDGRVVAKLAAVGPEPSAEYEAALWAEMISSYSLRIAITVQGLIWPALETLNLEHRFREADFVSLAAQSPVVPEGRERLFGKALFLGYDRDYVGALHILVPQIEHMVRTHLRLRGFRTSTLSDNGIETENGLSTLIDIPDVTAIFGEDLAFELRALFCDSLGPNLRNEVAHGLLDDQACHSAPSIYAWWITLKLVYNTFWASRQLSATEDTASAGTAPSAPSE
jgi:Domain of unknown function (DUF4209)